MIIWITGNTGSGKTTLAKKFYSIIQDPIILDGNEVREIWPELGLDNFDRRTNNLRVAKLALLLAGQGYNIIVSVIAPFEELRKEINQICSPVWIYIPSQPKKDAPYEVPKKPDFIYEWE